MLSDKLTPFINRYNELTQLLSSPDIGNDIKRMTDLSKEQGSILAIYTKATQYKKVLEEIEENKALAFDAELGELAKEELKILEPQVGELEEEIKKLLIPADPNDKRNIYIELRAGTGGDEAAIFVGDLFNAYVRYAELKGWKIELMSTSPSDAGGYKELIALIKGEGAYSSLKYESGVHRSGGQSVNTTDSAVRITHIPTGIVVTNQDQKSQHKNKERAMKILKARIYDMQMEEIKSKEMSERKEQVGSGDRSARIRTYNYPQNRMSDHRITLTLYRLEEIMQGGLMDDIIEPLIADMQSKLMEQNGL